MHAPTRLRVRSRPARQRVSHGVVLLEDVVADCNERFCAHARLRARRDRRQGFPRAVPRRAGRRRVLAASAGSGAGTRRAPGSPQWFPWQFLRLRRRARRTRLVHLAAERGSGSRAHRRRCTISSRLRAGRAGRRPDSQRAAAAGARSLQGGDLRQGSARAATSSPTASSSAPCARRPSASSAAPTTRSGRPRSRSASARTTRRCCASARATEFEVIGDGRRAAHGLSCRSSSRSSAPTASSTACAASRPTSPSASARRTRSPSAALAVSSAQGASVLPGARALPRDDPRSRRGPDRRALRREAAGHACASTRSSSTARSARTSSTRWPARRARRSSASASASIRRACASAFRAISDLRASSAWRATPAFR